MTTADHEHTWKQIWKLTQDGTATGAGFKCSVCGTLKWSGRKPDGWDIF